MKPAPLEQWRDLANRYHELLRLADTLTTHPAVVAGGPRRADLIWKLRQRVIRLRASLSSAAIPEIGETDLFYVPPAEAAPEDKRNGLRLVYRSAADNGSCAICGGFVERFGLDIVTAGGAVPEKLVCEDCAERISPDLVTAQDQALQYAAHLQIEVEKLRGPKPEFPFLMDEKAGSQ